jgi:hypothetical protein
MLMSFFIRQRCLLLLAAVMAIAAPGISYAQLGALKEKAIETLTNGVMKELEKKFTEVVAKEAISAATKAIVVSKLSEMSRPIVKNFIDSATSGKLPNQAELVNAVLKDIIPRVPELVVAARMEGDGVPDAKTALTGTAGSVAQITGQVQTAVNAQLQNNYDDEKDFTTVVINEGNAVRITKYVGKKTDVNIPPLIGNLPVTEIGDQAFIKKGLTSVVIPDTVHLIGNMAFAENQIGSVSIGANVYITNNAFESSGYNSFSTVFYNSQGRKAGTYINNWRLVSSSTTGKTQAEETQTGSKRAAAAPASSDNQITGAHPLTAENRFDLDGFNAFAISISGMLNEVWTYGSGITFTIFEKYKPNAFFSPSYFLSGKFISINIDEYGNNYGFISLPCISAGVLFKHRFPGNRVLWNLGASMEFMWAFCDMYESSVRYYGNSFFLGMGIQTGFSFRFNPYTSLDLNGFIKLPFSEVEMKRESGYYYYSKNNYDNLPESKSYWPFTYGIELALTFWFPYRSRDQR